MAAEQTGFRQFEDIYDLSCPAGPNLYYAICSTPRSGSHYLGHVMHATGLMGSPLEYFHPDHFRKWSTLALQDGVSDTINYIKARRTSPNGCFGFKAHFPEFSTAFSQMPFDTIFPGCRFILVERRDILQQAISLVRAQQTNRWISMHLAAGEARYDFDAINNAILRLLEEKASWQRFFAVTGRDFLPVNYESLVAAPDRVVTGIGRYLGIDNAIVAPGRPIPEKQANAESAEWRDRFLLDATTQVHLEACERLTLRAR